MTETPLDSDQLRQEHAVDHAAAAPATATLDTSLSPGPGGDTGPAREPAQHGLAAHGHGGGAVPAVDRGERPASFDVADFPVPSGREEDWRFTPLDRLGGLLDDEPSDAHLEWTTDLPDGVEVVTVPAGDRCSARSRSRWTAWPRSRSPTATAPSSSACRGARRRPSRCSCACTAPARRSSGAT